MAANLKIKLLQHLAKKNANKGFTLIELLVVVVIIGILAAIALPSFLAQTAKAKQAEARNTLGSWAKAQKAYRTEHTVFASGWTDLSLGLGTQTKNYNYENVLSQSDATEVDGFADSRGVDLKSYSARVIVVTDKVITITPSVGDPYTEVSVDMPDGICEAANPGTDRIDAPTITAGNDQDLVVDCGDNVNIRTGKSS
ncbi:MAG: type IV pilin-like G/H family protein [Gloeomargarita sp. HHBFW_bins_205]